MPNHLRRSFRRHPSCSFPAAARQLVTSARTSKRPCEAPTRFRKSMWYVEARGEGNFGSEMRIGSSVSGLLIPLSRGQFSSSFIKANCWPGCFRSHLLVPWVVRDDIITQDTEVPSKLSTYERYWYGIWSNLGRLRPRTAELPTYSRRRLRQTCA